METGKATSFADRAEEYIVCGIPDRQTMEAVSREKKIFTEQYGQHYTHPFPGMIPFVCFEAKEHMENTLVRWIQNICNLQSSFIVHLNNFNSIPSHTIYFRIQDPQPFVQFGSRMKILNGFNESNDCSPVRLIRNPGLILAEGLSEAVYHSAVHRYSEKTFHTSFRLEKLVLIQKDWKEKSRLVNTFNFPPGLTN